MKRMLSPAECRIYMQQATEIEEFDPDASKDSAVRAVCALLRYLEYGDIADDLRRLCRE